MPEAHVMSQNEHCTGEGSPCKFSRGHSHFKELNVVCSTIYCHTKMHFVLKTGILYHLSHQGSFLGNSAGKESACNARRPGLIPGLGRSPGEGKGYPLQFSWASLVAQLVKKSACNAADLDSIPGWGRSPGGGHGHALQYSCLGNSHGQRSLAGYSPWGHKEWDMTERLSTAHIK